MTKSVDELMRLAEAYALECIEDRLERLTDVEKARAALRSALEEVVANDRRYRWLKLNGVTPGQRPAAEEVPLGYKPIRLRVDTAVYLPATWNAAVDAAIDAAMQQAPEQEG